MSIDHHPLGDQRQIGWRWCSVRSGDMPFPTDIVLFLTSYVALWSLVLLGDILSEPSAIIARTVAIISLATLSIYEFSRQRVKSGQSRIIAASLALAGAAGVFIWPDLGMLFGAAWIAGLASLRCDDPRSLSFARRCVVSSILGSLVLGLPFLWNLVNHLSVEISALLHLWGGGEVGGSASGLALFIAVSPFLVGRRGQPLLRRLGPWFIATVLFFVNIAIASLVAPTPDRRFTLEMIYGGILLLLCTTPRASDFPTAPARPMNPMTAVVGLAGMALLAFLSFSLPGLLIGQDATEPRSILFIEQALLGSWRMPSDAAPGDAFTGATFGLFPKYLAESGHNVVRVPKASAEALADADLAVIINPGDPFTVEERELLESFVRSGGGLLILGDHTNIGGMMNVINDVAATFGVSLVFDSAVSEDPGWSHTLRILHPFSEGFDATAIPVSIGASVDTVVHPLVTPLLVGHRASSDPGEVGNASHAYLGDLKFGKGERYGDVVLAAVRYYGHGKVVLFGDTSPFQNSAMAISHAFAEALVRWMTNRTGSWRVPVQVFLVFLCLALAILLMRLRPVRFTSLTAIAVAIGMLAVNYVADPFMHAATHGPHSALVDVGHGNMVRWEPLEDRGLEGLTINLARSGRIPRITRDPLTDLPSPENSVLVTIAPTGPFSDREQTAVLQWINQGGRLLITTGWPHAVALHPFLSPLGLSVAPVPLGTSRPRVAALENAPQLLSAWPLLCTPDWTVIGSVDWYGVPYTVIAERAIGNGSVIVIGDAAMFSNENLEGKGFFYAENIALLEFLLDSGRRGDDG